MIVGVKGLRATSQLAVRSSARVEAGWDGGDGNAGGGSESSLQVGGHGRGRVAGGCGLDGAGDGGVLGLARARVQAEARAVSRAAAVPLRGT